MLRMHIHTHSGFRCGQCSKVFSCATSLEKHTLLNSAENSFKCDLCGKAFCYKSHLKKHKRVHREKNFTCKICDKTFQHKGDLNKHRKRESCVAEQGTAYVKLAIRQADVTLKCEIEDEEAFRIFKFQDLDSPTIKISTYGQKK